MRNFDYNFYYLKYPKVKTNTRVHFNFRTF